MKPSSIVRALIALSVIASVVPQSGAQQPAAVTVTTVRPVSEPETAQKFRFVFFWKDYDASTQEAASALQASIAKRAERAESSLVNITETANQEIVTQYQVSRAPMPLVLCIAPNGAVTGSMVRQVDDESVERLLVTPVMADVTKALQDKQIAVVHVAPDAKTPLPPGAAQFVADPLFQKRIKVVTLVVTDEAEARFLKDLQIKAGDAKSSTVVVFAPPGVAVGKFAAETTANQFGAAMHAAGKCCNDPNCKHNQQNQQAK